MSFVGVEVVTTVSDPSPEGKIFLLALARCLLEWFEPLELVWSSKTAWQWWRWDASLADDSGAKNMSLDFVVKLSWFSTLTVQWTGGGFALQLCSLIN